jgi:hypothetical protein
LAALPRQHPSVLVTDAGAASPSAALWSGIAAPRGYQLRVPYILITSRDEAGAVPGRRCSGLMASVYVCLAEMLRTQAEAVLEWDDAWAEVLTKHISHRNALHDAATAQATATMEGNRDEPECVGAAGP